MDFYSAEEAPREACLQWRNCCCFWLSQCILETAAAQSKMPLVSGFSFVAPLAFFVLLTGADGKVYLNRNCECGVRSEPEVPHDVDHRYHEDASVPNRITFHVPE